MLERQSTDDDLSPSDNQLRNLSRMTTILSGNWRASMLAHSLWEFYNYQLYCTVRADDGKPKFRKEPLLMAGDIDRVR